MGWKRELYCVNKTSWSQKTSYLHDFKKKIYHEKHFKNIREYNHTFDPQYIHGTTGV